MPVPSGFGLVQFIFSGSATGPGGCMVTLGVDHAFDETPTTLATELADAFGDNICPPLVDDVSLTETRLRIGTPEGEIVVSVFGDRPGNESGPSLPPNCAWPATKFSAFGGRANRGRWFLPGIAETLVDQSGAISETAIDDMNLGLAGFLVDLAAADFTPVILHSDEELAPTVILAMISGNLIYTRGSRLRS